MSIIFGFISFWFIFFVIDSDVDTFDWILCWLGSFETCWCAQWKGVGWLIHYVIILARLHRAPASLLPDLQSVPKLEWYCDLTKYFTELSIFEFHRDDVTLDSLLAISSSFAFKKPFNWIPLHPFTTPAYLPSPPHPVEYSEDPNDHPLQLFENQDRQGWV